MDFLDSIRIFDERLFEWMFVYLSADWLANICNFLVRDHNLFPVLLVFFVFYTKKDRKKALLFFIMVIVTLAVSELAVSGLKELFERPRPAAYFGIQLNTTSLSFPSAHAFNTMVQAVLWSYWLGSKRGLFFSMSFSIGVARMIARYHFPGDIFGGWVLGLLFGLLVVALIKIVVRKFDTQGQFSPG
ncbi:MAG: phosphatase PAP2 family protein [Leptospirales bacterium]